MQQRSEMSRQKSRIPRALKKGLLALVLITAAIIITLSFLGLAGNAGDGIDHALALGFGLLRFALPPLLVLIAYLFDHPILEDGTSHSYAVRVTGGILLVIALAGLLHSVPTTQGKVWAGLGIGGGYLGYLLNFPLIPSFGIIATRVLFVALSIASLLFLGTTSFSELLALPARFFDKIREKFQARKNVQLTLETVVTPPTFIRRLLTRTPKTKATESLPDEEDEEEEEKDEPEAKPIIPTSNHTPQLSHTGNHGITTSTPSRTFILPPLRLLKRSTITATAGDITRNMQIIEKTFGTFGIPVEMAETRVGPSVTQYALRPADGVKLAKITALANDLSLALAAHPIRIEAPIPGKSLVGIEVPNQRAAIVTLHDLLSDPDFEAIKNNFQIALGKDVSGKAQFVSLPSLPHLLVAGATGSGKTVCINTIILSLMFQHTPDELRFIMVDPKRVELPLYNGIPHLLTPVITDVSKTVNALKWAIGEMERRFDLLSKAKKRDIASYNKEMAFVVGGEKLPMIVIVVDELADLMVTAGAEIEGGIIRLAQMARAVGIHLILATQRPSVDVITGLIKANIPGRIAFSVSSITDSRTILDMGGAEKLLGRGDMLYTSAALSKPKRLQGAFVSEEEMKKVIDFIKQDEPPTYDDTITDRAKQVSMFGESASESDDPLYHDARQVIIQAGKASASYLQRRLKVGYARAARLLDMLEEAGVIGPGDGAKPRDVLIAGSGSATMKNDGMPEPIFDEAEEEVFEDEETDEITGEKFDELK